MYHIQVTLISKDDEHLLETVYYIHLKPIVLSDVCNLIKQIFRTYTYQNDVHLMFNVQ